MQISQEMVSIAHVHQLTVSLLVLLFFFHLKGIAFDKSAYTKRAGQFPTQERWAFCLKTNIDYLACSSLHDSRESTYRNFARKPPGGGGEGLGLVRDG